MRTTLLQSLRPAIRGSPNPLHSIPMETTIGEAQEADVDSLILRAAQIESSVRQNAAIPESPDRKHHFMGPCQSENTIEALEGRIRELSARVRGAANGSLESFVMQKRSAPALAELHSPEAVDLTLIAAWKSPVTEAVFDKDAQVNLELAIAESWSYEGLHVSK